MFKKKCPKCGRQYGERSNYCPKCAVKLEKNDNRCSNPKDSFCERRVYEDDDVCCEYCGTLTTYALEREERTEKTKNSFAEAVT